MPALPARYAALRQLYQVRGQLGCGSTQGPRVRATHNYALLQTADNVRLLAHLSPQGTDPLQG